MNELKIRFDFMQGPIWKDKFNAETGEFSTGISVVDNDKALETLNKEANQVYTALYHYDTENRFIFDESEFEKQKANLLSLVQTIIMRLNEINDGTYTVIDEETKNLV